MNRPIIQSLWIGKEISSVERLSINSFLRNGHEFHLYTYGDVSNIPNGTVIRSANEIIPEDDIFTYQDGSYAIFADWFRWALLRKKGGFWVDTDVVCLKPFEFVDHITFGYETKKFVGTAVLGFPPGHNICEFLERVCCDPNIVLPYDSKKDKARKSGRRSRNEPRSNTGWGEAGGPMGFTKALKHFDLLVHAKPINHFYPIHWSNWSAIFDETFANDCELIKSSYAIHLWNETSREHDEFDKNNSFAKDSLFEQLKTKFL